MRILLVEDHAIVRSGLVRLFSGDEVTEAPDARTALTAFRAAASDLVVLDLNLPDGGGFDLIRRFAGELRPPPVMVLSMHGEPIYAVRALEAGAKGYLSKSAAPDEILTAVRTVARGGRYIEARMAQAIALRELSEGPLNALSARELEVLRLLAAGRSLQEIAEALGVAYKTIANGASQLKSKLGVASTADLIRMAVEFGGQSAPG
jgi:DNA-binding NarL/FixJ family response regulator